ncbi:MAG: DUF63 family protein [Halobacteriaceae archaeon]
MVLPAGTELPPAPYLAVAVAGLAVAGWLLARVRPPVDDRTVLAFAPWMVAGAFGYVAYQVGTVPAAVAPLTGSPTVYASTFTLAALVWVAARRWSARPLSVLGAAGAVVATVPGLAAVGRGLATGAVDAGPSLAALVVAALLAGATWWTLGRVRPRATAVTGAAGALTVFGHALDGVSTAVGVDVLGFGERTPISRVVIEFARALPSGEVLGGGWLFVLVKLGVAAVVVALFVDYVRERPREGYLLLGVVAAVGLGPGAHNLLLFAVTSP